MKFKFLQAAVAGLMFSVCNTANAGIIFIDNEEVISDGFFSYIGGTNPFHNTGWDKIVLQPGTLDDIGGDFKDNGSGFGLFDDPRHFVTNSSLFLLSNTSGNFTLGDILFSDINGDVVSNAPVTFFGNYIVSSFEIDDVIGESTYNASGLGLLTYGSKSIAMTFDIFAQSSNAYGNFKMNFEVAQEPPSQVPEPSTLAIFALSIMGLASRRFKKQ